MEKVEALLKNYFKDLAFEETAHKYLVNGEPLKISVSGLIDQYKHKVDWSSIIKAIAKRDGISEADVSNDWKKKADAGKNKGNSAHNFGEAYVYDRTLKPKTGYDRAIVKFWNDLPDCIVPLALEIQMYHRIYMFGGTADILLYNKDTGQIYIADYKTNIDLFKNFNGQKMSAPFDKLLCNSYNHYQLQLSFYQILLEQVSDIKIAGRKLIWIKEDGTYIMYNLEDYTEELKGELKLNGLN